MSKNRAVVYMHSSEHVPEVADGEAKLVIGAGVYLGKEVVWDDYMRLYTQVYCLSGIRVLSSKGLFITFQNNAYQDGQCMLHCCDMNKRMLSYGLEVVDERVWRRETVGLHQVPFSQVLIWRKPGCSIRRRALNLKSKQWCRGVWDFLQTKGGQHHAFPDQLCKMIIEVCTDPGDLIVDLFAGTGRLLGWAVRMGRKAVGYEIDKNMIELLRNNNCYVQEGRQLHRPTVTDYHFGKNKGN